MAATYSQLPGTMNLAFRASDEFYAVIDFDIGLTGYTATSSIVSLVTGSQVVAPTTSVSDAAAGKVSVSLTEQQTTALAPGSYGWNLSWVAPGTVTRNVLA